LNFLVQRLINRIIFLRICEDRELEKYRALQEAQTYAELKALFINADERYNSDLFDFIEDKLSLNVDVSSEVLIGIFRQLYYPESPYAFSVVEASILGDIYERFLAKEILIDDGTITVTEKPEVVASGGVVPTPKYIVDVIIQKTLEPLCVGKSPSELIHLRVADIACGSGSFLLAAYEYLLNHYLEWYLQDGAENHSYKVYESGQGRWCLTLPEKHRILLAHIFGVDIDQQAVEIARFSLLLKVLENERETSIAAHLKQSKSRALPNLNQNIQCGNSLVDKTYFEYDSDALLSEERFNRINPLDWDEAFPSVFDEGGFYAIVGNPPYIRIQNMRRYSPEEVDYYQSDFSPYKCSQSDNFDKYSLFIERGLSLLESTGRLGYIVPHKFFTIRAGRTLRHLLSSGRHIVEIVHFGEAQVFGQQRANYTCILELTKQATSEFTVEHVTELTTWRSGQRGVIDRYASKEIGDEPWEFVSPQTRCLFERLRDENPTTLEQVANIFVGIQTSADKIYIIKPSFCVKNQKDGGLNIVQLPHHSHLHTKQKPTGETADSVQFTDVNGATWTIEKEILRPCLRDVELPPFCQPQPNTYIIFPYKTDGKLYIRDEMMKNFPNCWEYLVAHKGRLVQRSISGGTPETWYRYGRSQSLTKFNSEPKLIWPVLSLEPRYAYDDQNIVFTGGGNGPYYGLRPLASTSLSIHYLQAVLSHPVIEAMVRARGSSFRGGYKSHGKQFIKDLPIYNIDFSSPTQTAVHNQIVELVKKLITVTESESAVAVPTQRRRFAQQRRLLRQRIEKLVEELYGLDVADLDTVKAVDSDEEE